MNYLIYFPRPDCDNGITSRLMVLKAERVNANLWLLADHYNRSADQIRADLEQSVERAYVTTIQSDAQFKRWRSVLLAENSN